MNRSTVCRIVWKEYRVQRGFWIAMGVLATLASLIALVSSMVQGIPLRVEVFYAIAMAAVALYTAGCGAVLFATEHEVGTYDFQRALPVTAGEFFLGKLSFAAASCVALAALLGVVASLLARGAAPEEPTALGFLCGGAVTMLELLAWSVFFSLVLYQPLVAAILAMVLTSVAIHGVLPGFAQYQWTAFGWVHYFQLLPARLAAAAFILGLDAWLGHRWLRERSKPGMGAWRLVTEARSPAAISRGVSHWAGFSHLLWQQWRQSKTLILTLGSIYAGIVVWAVLASNRAGELRDAVLGSLVGLGMFAAIAGSCTFLPDRGQHRYRFFADRGVRPGPVWLSRLAVWVLVLFVGVLLSLAVAAIAFAAPGHRDPFPDRQYLGFAAASLGLVVLVFAAGQTCSMLFRSPFLGVTFGLFTGAALSFWAVLMLMLGIPLIWSVAPLPVCLFLATWLHTPHWLLERIAWRARAPLALAIGGPVVSILIGVVLYRIYEIPLTSPGFSVEEFQRPPTDQDRETAAVYAKALWALDAATSRSDETARKAAIATVLAAARKKGISLSDPRRQSMLVPPNELHRFRIVLLAYGEDQKSRGELEEAWQVYEAVLSIARQLRERGTWYGHFQADQSEQGLFRQLREWMAHPKQTSDLLRRAVQSMQAHVSEPPLRDTLVKNLFLRESRIVDGHLDGLDISPREIKQVTRQTTICRFMPWERWRARRLLNLAVHEKLEYAATARRHLEAGRPFLQMPRDPLEADRVALWMQTCAFEFWKLRHQSVLSQWDELYPRVMLLRLALHAYQLDHGSFPPTLDALAPAYLTRVPQDPFDGAAFRYFPQGVPNPVSTRDPTSIESGVVPANVPFIWSAGDALYKVSDSPLAYQWRRGDYLAPLSDAAALEKGWAFPLGTAGPGP